MEVQLRDSFLFLEPSLEEQPPQATQAASQSRAIDIKASWSHQKYRISSQPHYVTSAAELRSIVDRTSIEGLVPGSQMKFVDRVYYENNWPFARNYLCRKFVKGVFEDWLSVKDDLQEDPSLIKYQLFLYSADSRDDSNLRHELDFSYSGHGSTSKAALVCTKDRLLYHFGFDWMAILQSSDVKDSEVFKRLRIGSKEFPVNKCIVRRRTCIASILKMQSTAKLQSSGLCPPSWESFTRLKHRRTVILFNELHASEDGLNFKDWISPEKSDMWEVVDESNVSKDSEITAVCFLHRFTFVVWKEVIHAWHNVVDQASEHIRTSEKLALDKGLSIEQLENLAQDTWEDSLSWFSMQKLLVAHQKVISNVQENLKALALLVNHNNEDQLQTCIDQLKELENIVSEDFSRREENISNLVYNIIGVRNAQAAQQYSESMGRITWISFIFFPLIAVSGLFGMNVDLLADNPSIKWYFIVAIPFLVLVLGVALLMQYTGVFLAKIRARKLRKD